MGSLLRKGQQLRPIHPALAEREWGLSPDAVGTVLCAYRAAVGHDAGVVRVDIRFGADRTIWGVPAAEFVPLPESQSGASDMH
jgi:hypothetical protein